MGNEKKINYKKINQLAINILLTINRAANQAGIEVVQKNQNKV